VREQRHGASDVGIKTPPSTDGRGAALRLGFHVYKQLEQKDGHWGLVASKLFAADQAAAAEAGHSLDLYGIWHGEPGRTGSRYFRRRKAHRGKPLPPNTYPPMVTTKGWAAKGRVDRLVGEWSASGSSSSSSSGGGGSGGGNDNPPFIILV
jgi:uncharacterized membrane protein YgcG